MSKQDIKKATNRTWDSLYTLASAVGGALLTFTESTPSVAGTDITWGQIVGAVLLATVVFRVVALIFNEN